MKKQQRLDTLLHLLASGQFISGEMLADKMQVTRTSIGKDIKALQDCGANIFSVKGRGYKLAKPFSPLDAEAIHAQLSGKSFAPINVTTFLDSTNDEMKRDLGRWQQGEVLCAEIQSAGRGRRGRQWIAPIGGALTFSMYWQFEQGHQSLTGLSLVIGVAICRVLRAMGIAEAGVKWPNDLYINMAKTGGVLVELEGQLGSTAQCIIGVGLNVNVEEDNLALDQPISDIASNLDEALDRNQLAATLFESLWDCVSEFEQHGFQPFINEWQLYDVFRDQKVVILLGDKRIVGVGQGVDASGALLLETEHGIEIFHGGEVSLRGVKS